MAARRPGFRHNDDCRAKIKASALINRLNDIALGNVTADSTQVSAAKALLNKVLPDLKAIEHSGDADNPMQAVTQVQWHVVKPSE
jgi:hypothetical protein